MLDSIDIDSSVPVYIQIENEVQFGIASGRLKTDDRLPSVRELSERVKVNPNTVAKSYRDLEVMGLVYTRQGMGVFVAKGATARCREECLRRVVSRIHEVVSEAKAAGFGPKEIKDLVNVSLGVDTTPYGETPKQMLEIAKKFKPKA